MDTKGSAMLRLSLFVTAAILFILIATFNVGGYQYGVSDQAVYIPAVLMNVNPDLYPQDSALINAQGHLLVFDEVFAMLSHITGLSLPILFFSGYLSVLLLLFTATTNIGRTLYQSWWAVATLSCALTLRHHIAGTAVNTLESYLHPRMLAFAIGVGALLAFLRGRTWIALALALGASLFHPTTALWFLIWIGVGIFISNNQMRRPLFKCVIAASIVGIWAFQWGPLQGRLARMDPSWLAIINNRDYLFPETWPWYAWGISLIYLLVIVTIYYYRRSLGTVTPQESGLVGGCTILLLCLFASLPLISLRVAFIVQLQPSRIFWMLDLLATIYIVWLLVESPLGSRQWKSPLRARRIVAVAFAIAALSRGGYVMLIEHPDRSVFQIQPPKTEWIDVMNWTSRTPLGTHLLVDPGHAWRYGHSVRVAGKRDVYLEEVKDIAVSIFSESIASRVQQRLEDLGNFQNITPTLARTLATQYDLDYLITEALIDLPIVYRNSRFNVYTLKNNPF